MSPGKGQSGVEASPEKGQVPRPREGKEQAKGAARKGYAAKSALRRKEADTPVEVDSVSLGDVTLRSRNAVRFQEEDAVYELACRLEREDAAAKAAAAPPVAPTPATESSEAPAEVQRGAGEVKAPDTATEDEAGGVWETQRRKNKRNKKSKATTSSSGH